MIINKLIIAAALLLYSVSVYNQETAKDNRTQQTKIADLLAQMPASDQAYLNAMMNTMASFGESGLVEIAGMLTPPGKGNDAGVRFAVGSFSNFVIGPGQEEKRLLCQKAWCLALETATDPDTKSFLIAQVQLVGNDLAVPCVEKYLLMDRLSDPAARALATINTPEAGRALLEAVDKAQGPSQISIVEALGDIKYTAALEKITALASSPDTKLRKVSLYALARFGLLQSESVLFEAAFKCRFVYEPAQATSSYLLWISQLVENGNKTLAEKKCIGLLKSCVADNQVQTRAEALSMLVSSSGEKATAYLYEALKSNNRQYRLTALGLAQNLKGEKQTLKWVKKAGKMDGQPKADVITMLGERGDPVALPFIKQSLTNRDEVVRLAAIDATAQLGRESALPDLLGVMKKGGAVEVTAIKTQLLCQGGDELVPAIEQALPDMPDNAKIALLEVLSSRRNPDYINFIPLFNGKDLTGWKGLVENPVIRSKMNPDELDKAQVKADDIMRNGWKVENGILVFTGNGENLCTTKSYGDFEMIVDWKITEKGDAGIYLRGSPQVQIWDTSRRDAGAQVGSGGLYNNQVYERNPLHAADNPVGEWNTFRITMIGERVTVYLNGVLVVDNIIMENYWDRSIPIFPMEQIELQAHGTWVGYRNIYIREIPRPEPYQVSEQEKAKGYEELFDGLSMFNWTGNTRDYVVEDGCIAVYPKYGGKGNLYTKAEYGDFSFRFEFQLTPGANNGIGIRTPMEGDAAYLGMEIQVLDNTAGIYRNLKEYQYHGSVYGVIPAKREYLKPVGEWNEEEIIAKGNHIQVILNGTTIVDGDIAEASRNGTLDRNEHPGLKNAKGHIGFLGHGSDVKFRNLRIKDLTIDE